MMVAEVVTMVIISAEVAMAAEVVMAGAIIAEIVMAAMATEMVMLVI